jgi:hypothetical protein
VAKFLWLLNQQRRTKINWNCLFPETEFMKGLTQYGLMAEKHWREHRPKMVKELETKGQLQSMLIEAERKTKDEMADLRIKLMKQGKTAEQAHRQAWEMVRERYILLPEEMV